MKSIKQVIIENTRIFGWTTFGIFVTHNDLGGTGARNIVISNSTISGVGLTGIRTSGGVTSVSRSVIAGNGTGLSATLTGVINADSNLLTGNGTAVQAE